MEDLTTTSLRIMLGELLDPMDSILVFLAIMIGGGSFFLRVFLDHGVAYGGLGMVISLLLYLYVSTAVLLFGAGLKAELRRNVQKGRGAEGGA